MSGSVPGDAPGGAPGGEIDEMVDGRGGVRPHWRGVLGALGAFDPAALAERAGRLERAAEEEGAASLPGADGPAWRCDPVPLPLPPAEFAQLEAGLIQRARLLEALLADLYGPQAVLADGTLPPALVFANPGFLRPCRTDPAPGGPSLQCLAVDLARGPDGAWRVLADHTSGAPGAGYARESRRLLARVLPELFRSVQVRQLGPFFEAWGDALLRAGSVPAPAPIPGPADGRTPGRDGPAVVALLTPGTDDPHWSDHLLLSRELGCTLVQGRDLTVQGGGAFLKTLRGLQPVHVLLRRVEGDRLDPLELAPRAGVPGLMDAARVGAVRVLNGPGAGLVEAPVLAAFLPALCRRLLGETLRLPGSPTLWLADREARDRLLRQPGRWRVRPALDAAAPAPCLADAAGRAALDAALAARPWEFAAAGDVRPSAAPALGPDGLAPRPVVLRMFLMHDGRGWTCMEGGLARLVEPGNPAGGPAGSPARQALPGRVVVKDVWVLDQEARDIRGPAPLARPRLPVRRGRGDLPSRVADDFYWFGRRVERLDGQARLARAALLRLGRGTSLPRTVTEQAVLAGCLQDAGLQDDDAPTPREALPRAVAEGGAFPRGLGEVARLVEALRDRLTGEMHGAFAHALRAARGDVAESGRAGPDGMVHAMAAVQRLSTAVAGVAAEGMVSGGGRVFLDLGRRIERGHNTALLLARVLDQQSVRIEAALRLALELCDSAITYRDRYAAVLQPAPALDLVLADGGNPRALAHQFARAARLLGELEGAAGLQGEAAGALARIEGLVARVAASPDPASEAVRLPPALRNLAAAAASLSDRVTRRYFAPLPPVRGVGLQDA